MGRKEIRASGERGSVLILSTVCLVIAMLAAALAVDLGRLASDKRTDQKIADLAALDAARDLTDACNREGECHPQRLFDANLQRRRARVRRLLGSELAVIRI